MVHLAAFILAAGFGTRISALSRLRPKPLLPLGATTPLARAVERLRAAGATKIVANAAHLAEQVVAAGVGLGIDVVVERAPSGTAGGLAAARERLGADRVAVWNGDIVADLDVGALVRALDEGAGPRAALAVHDRRAPGYGNVGVSADGRVVRLRGRSFPVLGEEAYGALFSAVHVLVRELVERAPREGCLVGDLYLPALADGAHLRAVPWEGAWHDIGDVASYLAANLALLAPKDARPSSSAQPALVFAGAQIAPGVELRRAIVGAGACVDGEGALDEVVVWPGARARAPLARAIVTGGGEGRGDGEIVPVDGPA
jgi:mannose-1-phosphate guanylyltransferase